ncbi:unnamed protein product [Tilletia laevis]|nr:unnamed protein product [Tilletia laevis]CAD6955456.1 unnamed protein product [Tilletia laevis]
MKLVKMMLLSSAILGSGVHAFYVDEGWCQAWLGWHDPKVPHLLYYCKLCVQARGDDGDVCEPRKWCYQFAYHNPGHPWARKAPIFADCVNHIKDCGSTFGVEQAKCFNKYPGLDYPG